MDHLNPFTLAAEDSPKLLSLLGDQPNLASSKDEHGYSLVHAAASYNHLDLLRKLVKEFHVDPNIKDEDGETALFVVETVEAAQILLEELGTDPSLKNDEDMTAEEKIQAEGDFTVVADFLRESRIRGRDGDQLTTTTAADHVERVPPLPPNVKLNLGSLEDESTLGEVADPALKQRIEELAARDDFQSQEGQNQLRELVTDALRGTNADERNTRARLE